MLRYGVTLAPCDAYRVWRLPDGHTALHVAAWLCSEHLCLAYCPHETAVATLHRDAAAAEACECAMRERWDVAQSEGGDAGVPRLMLEACVKFYVLHALRPHGWMRIEGATFVRARTDGHYDAVDIELAQRAPTLLALTLHGSVRSLPFFQVAQRLTPVQQSAFEAGAMVPLTHARVRVLPKLTSAHLLSVSSVYPRNDVFPTEAALFAYWERVYGYARVPTNEGFASVAFERGSFPLTYPLCFLLDPPSPADEHGATPVNENAARELMEHLRCVQCECGALFPSIVTISDAPPLLPSLLRPSVLNGPLPATRIDTDAGEANDASDSAGRTPSEAVRDENRPPPVASPLEAMSVAPPPCPCTPATSKKAASLQPFSPSATHASSPRPKADKGADAKLRLPSFKRTGMKRGREGDEGAPSKRARVSDEGMAPPHDVTDEHLHRLRAQGNLARLPPTALKSYLRKHGAATSGSKAELVARISKQLADEEEE